MTKRFLSLLLTVAVMLSSMAVTVGASEVDSTSGLYNLLEYSFPNGGDSLVLSLGAGTHVVTFDLPYTNSVRYVDMFVTAPEGLGSVYVVQGSGRVQLTVDPITPNNYRIYGAVSIASTKKLNLEFKLGSGGLLTFRSLYYSPTGMTVYSSPSTLTLEGWDQYTVTQDTGTSSVMLTAKCGSEGNGVSIGVGDYLVGVHNDDWRKYDYMNFTMVVYVATVNSISCTIDNQQIPIELNMVEGNIPDYDSMWRDESSNGENRVFYDVNVRVDLTGVNRTMSGDLIFTVAGTSGNASVALYDSRGYAVASLPDAEITWLQKIWLGIQDMISAIRGDGSASDDFNDQIQDEVDKLEQDQEIIESMTTPDLEGIVGEVDINADAGDGIVFISGIFNSLWNSPLSLVFMYSGIFALIAYLLFGRRR